MKDVTRNIIDFYRLKDFDFMGYKLIRPTFHHIVKREWGGGYTFNNGAVLDKVSHPYLHRIEYSEVMCFKDISEIFLEMIEDKKITKQGLIAIRTDLEMFEKCHEYDRTRKGKRLVRYQDIHNRIDLERLEI